MEGISLTHGQHHVTQIFNKTRFRKPLGLSCLWEQDFSIRSQPEQQEITVRSSQQILVAQVMGESGLLGSCPGLNRAALFAAGYSRYDKSLHINHPLLTNIETVRYSLFPPMI